MTEKKEKIVLSGSYRMFTKNTDPETAKQYFEKLFGYKPKECIKHKEHLFVGPIRD